MNTPTMITLAVIVLLVVGLALGLVFSRRQRTKRLQERFGPEYDRTLDKLGDQRHAESELEQRLGHVKSLNIRPLSAEETEHFRNEWRLVQAGFVDEPLSAIQKANQLIKAAMHSRGYPVDDFEQRAADISVDHPDLVEDYRGLRMIAVTGGSDGELTTEDLRQAMVHVRGLFEELVGTETHAVDTSEKERT